jgi:predicted sulfurtransferase
MTGKTRALFTRLVAIAGAIFWSPVSVIAADVDRIEATDAKKLVDKGDAILVDVRSRAAWDMGHIQGAWHIPGEELAARLSQLPKNKLIITYCT